MKKNPIMTEEDIKRLREQHLENIKDNKSKGLGDTIKKVTNKLGIKQCGGCKKRQEKLNRLFPYKKEPKLEE